MSASLGLDGTHICVSSGQALAKQQGTDAAQGDMQAKSAWGAPSMQEKQQQTADPKAHETSGSKVWAWSENTACGRSF